MLYRQPVVTETHGEGAEWTKNKLTADGPIWRVYHEFAQNYDEGMLRDWSSSIDTMLIFAGIFAATTTAFIIEAYKQMEPDYMQLLFLALTARDNTSSAVLAANFVAPTSARVVNRLWIGSLIVSLFAALVAILAKQWLCAYRVQNGGDLREWAQLRQFRFDCLGRWRVPEIIACLPLLLHISLLLFLTGLVVFMAPIDYGTMILALIVFVLGFVVYLGSMLSPLIWSSSPYRTQLTPVVGLIIARIGLNLHALGGRLQNALEQLGIASGRPLSPARYGKLPPATAIPSPVDPWHVVVKANGPTSLAQPLGWLATVASSGQLLSELVDAFGDMNLGRKTLYGLPRAAHWNMAAFVAETTSRSRGHYHPRELRVFNTAASLAIPMNVEHRIKTMCLALCNRLQHVSLSDAKSMLNDRLRHHPVIDAISNARLWLSLHSEVDLGAISATGLVSSPAQFGLPISMVVALLDRVQTCPSYMDGHSCGTQPKSGRKCGIARMFHLLLIWRELFVTDEAVDVALHSLRRVLCQNYRMHLSNWQGETPPQKLAFALAAALDNDSGADHFPLGPIATPLLRHLLWLLGTRDPGHCGMGYDIDVIRLVSGGTTPRTQLPVPSAAEVVGSDEFMRPAWAYPALVAFGQLGEQMLSSQCKKAGHPRDIAQPLCSFLRNAIDAYNPEQLRTCVDFITGSNFLLRVRSHDRETLLPVLRVIGQCVLRPGSGESRVDWFAQLLLAHGDYFPFGPLEGPDWETTRRKQLPSIVSDVIVAVSKDPGRDYRYSASKDLIASIHSVVRSRTKSKADLDRLIGDIWYAKRVYGTTQQTWFEAEWARATESTKQVAWNCLQSYRRRGTAVALNAALGPDPDRRLMRKFQRPATSSLGGTTEEKPPVFIAPTSDVGPDARTPGHDTNPGPHPARQDVDSESTGVKSATSNSPSSTASGDQISEGVPKRHPQPQTKNTLLQLYRSPRREDEGAAQKSATQPATHAKLIEQTSAHICIPMDDHKISAPGTG